MLPGMKASSVDLRQRVLAAVDRGMPRAQVVATFGVSLATLKRWLVLRRACPELTAQAPPGRPRTIGPEHEAALRAQLVQHPDATFVIVDESGTNLNLTPRYARAPRGARAYGQIPRNTPKNTTLIASLTLAGMGPAMTLEGATDTAAFVAYVEQVLAPALRPGRIVVLDNLRVHKSVRVRTLIEAHGAQLWYLPAYSPDLSPIEHAFSKLKTLLRRAQARTREALEAAIAAGLDQITPADAAGWFAHCGYRHEAQ
jgi:transposase